MAFHKVGQRLCWDALELAVRRVRAGNVDGAQLPFVNQINHVPLGNAQPFSTVAYNQNLLLNKRCRAPI